MTCTEAPPAQQRKATTRRTVSMTVAPAQFTGGTEWDSGMRKLNRKAFLKGGDTLIIKLNFSVGTVTVTETFIPENEQVYFKVNQFLSVPLAEHPLPYELFFTVASGSITTNPVTGTGVIARGGGDGQINANDSFRNVDLTNNSFVFSGIELILNVPPSASRWEVDAVQFKVTADSVT